MKFNSKFLTYGFVIFLGIVILSCCFSINIVEGATSERKCREYRPRDCPLERCQVVEENVRYARGWFLHKTCKKKE